MTERQRGRDGAKRTIGLSFSGSLTKYAQQPGLDQAKTRCQECHLGIPLRWQEPKYGGIQCHLPGAQQEAGLDLKDTQPRTKGTAGCGSACTPASGCLDS